MKTAIAAVISISFLIGARSAIAKSDYQQGFDFGVSDAKSPEARTLAQTASILEQHSHSFYLGWLDGFCSKGGPGGSDADELTFDCSDAKTYKSGFVHGEADGKCAKTGCDYYITQP